MADDSEFEFPPDQINSEVALPPEPDLGQIPFVILTQTPTDKLPPTHIPGAERRSIRQMLKGALHGYHRKPPFSALADLNLPHLRLSTSMDNNNNNNNNDNNNNNKSPDTLREAQKTSDLHYNIRNNIEDALHSNFNNSITNINNKSNNDNVNTVADANHGVETDFVHSSGQVNDAHVLHSGVEFDIAQSEHWGPKRAIRSEWSEKQVRDFYTALSQYGTDFTAIAVLFKNRTRVDIKRLYNRELRRHPNEVRVALENRTPIDLNLFNKLLKTKRREEAPKHKVLAAEEEQMLKQIASSAQNPSISSEMTAITTNANTKATKHSSKGGVSSKESNNMIADEFAFDDKMPSTGMEQVRRQILKPHRLNTNVREDENNDELHEPRTRKRDRVETSKHKAKQSTTTTTTTTTINSDNIKANEEENGMDTDGDYLYCHTQFNNNVGTMKGNTQHSSHLSRASSLHRAPQRQTHTKQKHQIYEKQQQQLQEELHAGHRIVPSISPSTSSLSPSPRRTDTDNDFDYKRSNNTHDEKDDDETILEMELRRQEPQELEEEEFSDQMTLAEAAWAGEFGALSEEVNGNESQVDDEFHFDDNSGEDVTH